MKNVCHFLRKSSQLRASFINNQISNHIDFTPFIVYRISRNALYDGGFSVFNTKATILDLSTRETKMEKLLYAGPKQIAKARITKIQEFIKENKIEIAHFHYGTDCGIFHPLLKKINIPSVVSFYGYDCSSFPKYMLGYGKRYLINRVFNHVSIVLAMSPDMKEDLIKAGCPEEKIIVHYHGADISKFNHEHDYSDRNIIRILILASIVPQKGHLFILKSIKKLVDEGVSNFQLRIVGKGKLEDELKRFCLENKLDKYVVFPGAIKYASAEMFNEYKNADIFVHPSIVAPDGAKEGIPGTIIEALSSGIPVISTYNAGIPYIIKTEETGILVKENDSSALKLEIEKLIKNRDLREKLGRAGQVSVQKIDLKIKEGELEAIYTNLISKYSK